MKRVLFAIAFVALSACVFAQVTINSSNYYKPGSTTIDIYTVQNDATDSVSTTNILTTPLNFGNSLETQFSVYGIVDTVTYAEPATEGKFTDETCSFEDGNGMRMHLKVTDEKAVCLGVSGALAQLGLNDAIDVQFEEAMDVITFPAQLNSQTNSNAHGLYLEHISALQNAFNDMEMGDMVYSFVTAEYDSIKVDIQVTFNSVFEQTGTLTLSGNRMMRGNYVYLRENRQFSYITNLYMHRIDASEFTIISDCTLTNPLFQMYFGSATINLGEALNELMGMSFPMTSTSIMQNYWRADDNYPIVEMTTNADLSYTKHLSIRYGENNDDDNFINETETVISIFPNPTTDILYIAVEDMDKGSMNIYSANGALVKEVNLNGNHNSINVNDLHNGCYFFRIFYGDKEIKGNFAKN
ncbi:MAG: T9SS type A sorting domain-containing protein [Bacteroidales bacterium]|nr:T9SS type A sorting domain-containing protein [Bacteroidales bacterium]